MRQGGYQVISADDQSTADDQTRNVLAAGSTTDARTNSAVTAVYSSAGDICRL